MRRIPEKRSLRRGKGARFKHTLQLPELEVTDAGAVLSPLCARATWASTVTAGPRAQLQGGPCLCSRVPWGSTEEPWGGEDAPCVMSKWPFLQECSGVLDGWAPGAPLWGGAGGWGLMFSQDPLDV